MAKHTAIALLVFAACAAQADIYSYKAADGSIVFTDQPVEGSKTVKVEKPMTVPAMKAKADREAAAESAQQPVWPEPQLSTLSRVDAESAEPEEPGYDASQNTSWSSDTQGISASPKMAKKKRAADNKRPAAEAKSGGHAPKMKTSYLDLQVVSPIADSSRWIGGELGVQLNLSPVLAAGHVVSLRVDGREVYVGTETSTQVPGVARGSHSITAAVLDADSGRQLIVSDSVLFHVQRANKNQPTRMLHPSIKKR